jgi:spore germination cell wall hydrolase CwlJ-like protein
MRIFIVGILLTLATLNGAEAKVKHHKRNHTVVHQQAPADSAVCMAQAIYYEAGHESRVGQIAVGKVIMNRVHTDGYASTVCGVVYERCQFAFTCRRSANIDWTKNQHLIELSKQVISGEYEDVTRGAISFNNRPFKNKGLIKTTKIGNHYFYRSYARVSGNKEI